MAPVSMTSAFLAVAVALGCACFGEASLRSTSLPEEVTQDLSQNSYTRNLLQTANSYGQPDGFKTWDGICQQGAEIPQSPIEISQNDAKAALDASGGDMVFNYGNFTGATAFRYKEPPLGVQVNSPMNNTLKVGKETWTLLQYHFHSPSEHTVDGVASDMEIDLVHKNMKTGKIAVVSVLMDIGDASIDSSALAQALAQVPAPIVGNTSAPFTLKTDTFTSVLTPAMAIPKGKTTGGGKVPAISYTGSLTAPPCIAGVQWYVLMESAPVGPFQVFEFQRLLTDGKTLGQNSRPVQPLLGRSLSNTF